MRFKISEQLSLTFDGMHYEIRAEYPSGTTQKLYLTPNEANRLSNAFSELGGVTGGIPGSEYELDPITRVRERFQESL